MLPVGIRSVSGRFDKGDVVELVCEGHLVAKAISNYSSDEMKKIAGKHSDDIESILGYQGNDDAFLSENIALL